MRNKKRSRLFVVQNVDTRRLNLEQIAASSKGEKHGNN